MMVVVSRRFSHRTKRQIRRERANIPTIAARALKTGILDFLEIAIGFDEDGGDVAQA